VLDAYRRCRIQLQGLALDPSLETVQLVKRLRT
jgi:hypothetical protein